MKTIQLLTAVCLLTGIFVSCGDRVKDTARIKTVKLDTVCAEGAQSLLQYPGKVKASEDITLAFRVSGTISRIYVQDGQQVKAGQLLAELDPTDYRVQLDATEAQYRQIKSEAERVIALYNDGGTTPAAYDKAVYGLKQITALYEHHKDELSYTKLYAPFGGYIQKHLFEAHETVGAGMPVLSMVGQGVPEVEISLPASEYIRRDRFADYRCTFDVYPGKSYPLQLIGITHKANSNQLYTMRLQLVTDGLSVPSAGMNTMVTISCKDTGNHQLKVASGALFQKDGKSFVYVYHPDNSTVKACEVSVIRLTSDGHSILVSSSLQPGDIVVSAGVHHIKDGETVKPLPAVTDTNIGGLL